MLISTSSLASQSDLSEKFLIIRIALQLIKLLYTQIYFLYINTLNTHRNADGTEAFVLLIYIEYLSFSFQLAFQFFFIFFFYFTFNFMIPKLKLQSQPIEVLFVLQTRNSVIVVYIYVFSLSLSLPVCLSVSLVFHSSV